MYDAALQSLADATGFQAGRVGQERKKAALIQERRRIEQELSSVAASSGEQDQRFETAAQAEEALERTNSERDARMRVLGELGHASDEAAKRRSEIARRRAELRREEDSIDDRVAVLHLQSGSPTWEAAARAQAQTRKQAIEAERSMLNAESDCLDATRAIIPLQRDLAKMRLEAADRSIEVLKGRAREAQMRDAAREVQRFAELAEKVGAMSPNLKAPAEDVKALARRLWGPSGVILARREMVDLVERTKRQTARVRTVASAMMRRYEAAGPFSPATEWLDRLPADLPTLNDVSAARRSSLAVSARLRREVIVLEESRHGEASLEAQTDQIRSDWIKAGIPVTGAMESGVRYLLQQRRNLSEDLLKGSLELDNEISNFGTASAVLIKELEGIRDFARRRVLWCRSAGEWPSLRTAGAGVAWVFWNPEWASVPSALDLRIGLVILAVCLGIAIAAGWQRIRHHPGTPLSVAGVLRGVVGCGAPALGLWVALSVRLGGANLGPAMRSGLLGASTLLLILRVIAWLVAPRGAPARILASPDALARHLGRDLGWLSITLPLGWGIVLALAEAGNLVSGDPTLQAYNNSAGRLFFIAVFLGITIAAVRLLDPTGSVAVQLSRSHGRTGRRSTKSYRTAAVALLLFPPFLALLGYYATALVIARSLFWTAVLSLCLGVLSTTVHRWRERRNELLKASAESKLAASADAQVRQLVRFAISLCWIAGMLAVWNGVFPAVSMIDEVRLGAADSRADSLTPAKAATPNSPGLVGTRAIPSSTDVAVQAPGPKRVLTLLDVLNAVLAALVTALLVRNVPGVLDFLLLARFRVHAGAAYAWAIIARYAITLIGVVTVSQMLGIDWSHVQWLVAALTFGIGFGLQEVFANLAAGVILLLDRSVRVGDAVSIGDLTGRVSRIQMRATTVTLFNRSEMVVPNREFITSKLVNWTLSLPETRVEVDVGVPYGSDLELVRTTLYDIAAANANVLGTPAPSVLITRFSENAITFQLQAFCMYEFGRSLLLDELHSAVYREFKHRGIGFAATKVDVNFHSALPAPVATATSAASTRA